MARLDLSQLQVETFPTASEQQGIQSWTGSTGYCCDTRFDCSAGCRQPTNICEVCG